MQPLDLAILSLLADQPMTGYSLKKKLDASIGHIWSTTQSHIYKALRALAASGDIEMQLVPQQGKPDRKVYSVTSAGRQHLLAWLQQPLRCEPVRESWLIQLFFSKVLSDDEIQQLFQQRIADLEDRQAQCAQLQASSHPLEDDAGDDRSQALIDLTYAYSQAFYQFQKEWQQKALSILDQLPPKTQ